MVSHPRSPAALGAVAFLLALPGGGVAVASPVTDALPAIRAVDHEGKGNAAAAKAWSVIAAADASALPDILAGMDGANPLAANWLRAAVDAVVTKAGGSAKLPLDSLVRFLADSKHDPRARRLAFDLVRGADAARADKLLDGMVEDPSVELRRDAVAKVIARADALKTGEKKEEALAAYQKAFSASRNVEQIQALATTIRELGGTVDLTGHFGFLRRWRIVGPFDNTEGKGFATVYPPEETLDLSAALDGKEGKVLWQPVETGDEYGVVNVNLSYPPPAPPADAKPADSDSQEGLKGVIAYAVTEFVSAEDRPAEIRLGSKNAWKIWLNGSPVFEREEYHRGMEIDQYRMPVTLRKGPNTILIKVCQDEQRRPWTTEWEFQLRVCDEVGTAIHPLGGPDSAAK
ncbi:MAG: hypothetical protein EXS06_08690 [Planctomycetaceae bacterium]|nr:hypothetical protein [Planctomycetaceae bacterium]